MYAGIVDRGYTPEFVEIIARITTNYFHNLQKVASYSYSLTSSRFGWLEAHEYTLASFESGYLDNTHSFHLQVIALLEPTPKIACPFEHVLLLDMANPSS
jgi:hypothetical protein